MAFLLGTGLQRLSQPTRSLISLLHPQCDRSRAMALLADADALFEPAREEIVAALIHDRWADAISEAAGTKAAERWQMLRYSAAALAAHRQGAMRETLAALARAGVEPIALRGLWLAHAVYGDPALRPCQDADLVAPVESMSVIARVMKDLGYVLVEELPESDPEAVLEDLRRGYQQRLGAWTRPLGKALRVTFDMHATLSVVRTGWWPFRPSPQDLYLRSEPWQMGEDGPGIRALKPHFALVALCENICRHELAYTAPGNALIRYYDVLLVAQRLGPQDWQELVADGRRFRCDVPVGLVLRRVQEMWGPVCPPGVVEQMGDGGVCMALARRAAARPRWLGARGRTAVFYAASTRAMPDALRFVAKNLAPGLSWRPRPGSVPGAD